MSRSNFDACLAFTFAEEGGYADHPADPGGATKYGITIAVLAQARGRSVTKREVMDLTRAEAAQIYRRRFWDAVGGDGLPAGVDLAVWDYGVNSGPERGRAAYAACKQPSAQETVQRICARRRSFVRGLRTFSTFGKGWLARIARCEALGVRMALAAAGVAPKDAAREMTQQATKAAGKAKDNTKMATTTGAAAGASQGAHVAASGTNWELIAFLGVIGLILLGIAILAWRNARAESEREAAFRAQAERIEKEQGNG